MTTPKRPLTLKDMARLGGHARAAKLSAKRRKEIAVAGGKANAERLARLKALEASLDAQHPQDGGPTP